MDVAAGTTPRLHSYEDFDSYLREHNNFTTWLAEMLDGNMHTEFSYTFDGRELYGEDGGQLKPIFDHALVDAKRIANNDPNLSFEVRRRTIEREEYDDMLAIARGEAPNTMIVVSDFPPELMNAKRDVGGYNVKRKQTMLRVITRKLDGTLSMVSQSLDFSDRNALEELYSFCGYSARPGELLGQRMYLNLSATRQSYLADRLMGIYDRALTNQYGGKWYAGRIDNLRINTHEFVCEDQNQDLIEFFVRKKLQNPAAAEAIRYQLAAAMWQRYESSEAVISYVFKEADFYTGAAAATLNSELMLAGMRAHQQHKTFSGCGLSTMGGLNLSTDEQFEQAGYGNKTTGSEHLKNGKCVTCPFCRKIVDAVITASAIKCPACKASAKL